MERGRQNAHGTGKVGGWFLLTAEERSGARQAIMAAMLAQQVPDLTSIINAWDSKKWRRKSPHSSHRRLLLIFVDKARLMARLIYGSDLKLVVESRKPGLAQNRETILAKRFFLLECGTHLRLAQFANAFFSGSSQPRVGFGPMLQNVGQGLDIYQPSPAQPGHEHPY